MRRRRRGERRRLWGCIRFNGIANCAHLSTSKMEWHCSKCIAFILAFNTPNVHGTVCCVRYFASLNRWRAASNAISHRCCLAERIFSVSEMPLRLGLVHSFAAQFAICTEWCAIHTDEKERQRRRTREMIFWLLFRITSKRTTRHLLAMYWKDLQLYLQAIYISFYETLYSFNWK